MASRSFSTAAATLSFVVFAFCAVSTTKATAVVWTKTDGGTISDGGRAIVADKCWSHADFETGPLPLDKADTVGDDSDVFISFEVETLNFPAKVGIKSGYQTFLFDLDGCKSGNKRIPAGDCDVKHGTIRFSFNPNKGQFNFVVSDGEYPLHTIHSSSHSYIFIADLAKGTKLKNFLVQTKEERFRDQHLAKGAKQAYAGDGDDAFCPKESAACGGSCFGVCLHCGPPRYCMCYPNGYTDVYGVKHVDRPYCLKYDGDGITVPAASHGENAHRAFEGNGAKPDSVPSHFKLMKESASLLRRLYGRHGWRPHATEFGITPALADIIERIMELEDKSDL